MHIIGITGGTASGKSTFVALLKQKCKGLSITFISQDDYYKDNTLLTPEELNTINFDHPDSLDFDLLAEHINLLNTGKSIDKPTYSFEQHKRTSKTETITPQNILIIEGILVLSVDKIRQLCDTTIFIDAPETIRIERRLTRDIAERGRTRESVLYQFETNIGPMHKQFIEPIKNNVDFIFDGTQSFSNPVNLIYNLITNINS